MQRESLEFGRGNFVGAVMRDQTFFEMPVEDQARILGWADGCPVVEELIDRSNPDPSRGPENMARRLAIEEGIFCGVSAAGACDVALRISETVENAIIVFIVCDRGDRYLSTGIFPA